MEAEGSSHVTPVHSGEIKRCGSATYYCSEAASAVGNIPVVGSTNDLVPSTSDAEPTRRG
jgi:hypothetical protein